MTLENTRPLSHQIAYYVINLETATDRRSFMEEQAAREGISMQFIRATTGAQWLEERAEDKLYLAKKRRAQHAYDMSPNEHACVMSHLRTYREFLKSDQKYCCILEDDAQLVPGFKAGIEGWVSSFTGWDMLRLYLPTGARVCEIEGLCAAGGRRVNVPQTVVGTVGLLYTRKAVEMALETLEKHGYWLPIDFQLGYVMQACSMIVCATEPQFILHPDSFQSDIDADQTHVRGKQNKPKRSLKQFILYKLAVMRVSRWKKASTKKAKSCVKCTQD